jgi:hypothetical protein
MNPSSHVLCRPADSLVSLSANNVPGFADTSQALPNAPSAVHMGSFEKTVHELAKAMATSYDETLNKLRSLRIDPHSTEACDALDQAIAPFGLGFKAPSPGLKQSIITWLKKNIRKALLQHANRQAMKDGQLGADTMQFVTDETVSLHRRRLATQAPERARFCSQANRTAKHSVHAAGIKQIAEAAGLSGFLLR